MTPTRIRGLRVPPDCWDVGEWSAYDVGVRLLSTVPIFVHSLSSPVRNVRRGVPTTTIAV
ncbi:MAG: hypothetical protein NTX54_02265 [Chloroflexi bacterium]|nr:hypothetical protein [Chloroflexota bacterium]